MSELSRSEKLFVANYLKYNGNGTKAYKACYPDCKDSTAKVNASRMLTRTNVKAALDKALDKQIAKITLESITSTSSLTERLDRISQKAEDKGEYSPSLKGIELIAKLHDKFRHTSDVQGNQKYIQNVFNSPVQINSNTKFIERPHKKGNKECGTAQKGDKLTDINGLNGEIGSQDDEDTP